MTFFPLAHDLLTSSLWFGGTPTQVKVWIYLLLAADPRTGIVADSDPAIATRCGLALDETLAALEWLTLPDPYSRTKEHDGRRLSRLPSGGYQILNYQKHKAQDHSTWRVRRFRETQRNDMKRNETDGNDTERSETPGNAGNEIKIEEQIQEQPLAVKSVGLDLSPPEVKQSLSRRTASATAPAEVVAVFEHWRTTMNKPRARLDARRSKLVAARLADGYDVATLLLAIDGCRRSVWHQGANDRGRRYCDLSLICRDAEHVDMFAEIATHGEARPMSNLEQHNARVLGMITTGAPQLPPSGCADPFGCDPAFTCFSDPSRCAKR